jgi:hypothetical protein
MDSRCPLNMEPFPMQYACQESCNALFDSKRGKNHIASSVLIRTSDEHAYSRYYVYYIKRGPLAFHKVIENHAGSFSLLNRMKIGVLVRTRCTQLLCSIETIFSQS